MFKHVWTTWASINSPIWCFVFSLGASTCNQGLAVQISGPVSDIVLSNNMWMCIYVYIYIFDICCKICTLGFRTSCTWGTLCYHWDWAFDGNCSIAFRGHQALACITTYSARDPGKGINFQKPAWTCASSKIFERQSNARGTMDSRWALLNFDK